MARACTRIDLGVGLPEDRGGNGIINMSVSVLSGNFRKFGGHVLISNFGKPEKLAVGKKK
jgi:hypothetical protein